MVWAKYSLCEVLDPLGYMGTSKQLQGAKFAHSSQRKPQSTKTRPQVGPGI